MSLEIAKSETLKYFVARSLDSSVIHEGFITPDQVVTTGQPELISADNENEHLGNLSGHVDKFPPLPEQGESVEAGQIYDYNGTLVLCRQSHNRTEHDPATIPALFVIHQVEGDGYLDWVVGEYLEKGKIRRYNGQLYVVTSPLLTVTGQTPDIVPAHYQPYVPPGDTWTDSGETVVALVGNQTIRVTDTAPFGAGQAIRISGIEATVSSIFTPGINGIMVINPHIPVSGGETIEIQQ